MGDSDDVKEEVRGFSRDVGRLRDEVNKNKLVPFFSFVPLAY